MSGGFFRGTSADQDTRFSNKQAKLLKSQKFAPELENLVDMPKVKMDVIRPWIAKRVTELIGFEDEVLINFIYGLLEGKAVNGKEIQISLTGFMERNTGKFMKELWSLLLSAQQNVSGVPQQFLDAKEEETKKKKAETERIANEIHRNKEEKLEVDQEKTRMGGEDSISRERRPELELDIKNDGRESTIQPTEDKEKFKRSGRRGHRASRSPDTAYRSPSPPRKYSASPSKSSNRRSHSNERGRSHSTSGGASSRSRSISSDRNCHLGKERSATPPRRRNIRHSPSPRHTLLRSRRRLTSHSRHRSPSPTRHRIRSPLRWRSRTPIHWRSRTPIRRRSRSPILRISRSPGHGRSRSHVRPRSRTPIRRSPVRYRSRTPIHCRSPSPVRRRSPSPVRRRSPSHVRRRSPSPVRRRSPSPMCRRSPYRIWHRSPSPSLVSRRSHSSANSPPSPIHRQIASPTRHSSPSLHRSSSPSRRRYIRSPSTPRQQSISPAQGRSSLRGRKRSVSPVRQRSAMEEFSSPPHAHRGSLSPIRRESMTSGRSHMQSSKERTRRHDNYSSVHRGSSDGRAELPVENRKGVISTESKLPIVSLRSPQRDTHNQDDLPGKNRDLSSPVQKSPFVSHVPRSTSDSVELRSASPHNSRGTHAHADGTKLGKTQPTSSDKLPDRADHKEHHSNQELSITSKATGLSVKGRESYGDDGARAKDMKISRADDSKSSNKFSQQESLPKIVRKSEHNNQNGSFYSRSKETNEGKVKEKRKHKKSDSQEEESDNYSSYDSYEDKKKAKRRRKEEKKVKKEKRRHRREERRRRREERRAEKLKSRSGDSGSSSSDLGRHHHEEDSVRVRKSQASNIQETESEQKRLEIELREKALETLRAKKGHGS